MEDNKRSFSGFNNDRNEGHDEEKQDHKSTYYSYGPYKSLEQEQHQPNKEITSVSSDGETSFVEITAPKLLRPFKLGGNRQPHQPESSWTINKPNRRSSFKSAFAAFMAGAVVVGSLMFFSDKTNLFTGAHAYSSSGASVSAPSGSGTAKPAAYDISRPSTIPQIVAQASPAVVRVESYVKQRQRRGGSSMYNDPMFRYFFGGQSPYGSGGGQNQQPNGNSGNSSNGSLQEAGMGSGFIFDQSGYILTNEHVVDGADEVHVVMEGSDKPYTAKVIGTSYDYDLAVLKIESDKPFPTLPLGNPDETAIGDWVIAIGNPLGFDHTVTVGVLSAKQREISIPDANGTRNYKNLLQTDASINPGNSGGPLLNASGQVIGINTAVSSQAQGIGFVIPTTTINDLLPNLKTGSKIPKPPAPFVGITLQDIDQQYQSMLKLASTDGALVYNVSPGGPAYKAGIKQWDAITAINGSKITTKDDVVAKVQGAKVGDKLTFTVIRGGQTINVDVIIGDMNSDSSVPQQ